MSRCHVIRYFDVAGYLSRRQRFLLSLALLCLYVSLSSSPLTYAVLWGQTQAQPGVSSNGQGVMSQGGIKSIGCTNIGGSSRIYLRRDHRLSAQRRCTCTHHKCNACELAVPCNVFQNFQVRGGQGSPTPSAVANRKAAQDPNSRQISLQQVQVTANLQANRCPKWMHPLTNRPGRGQLDMLSRDCSISVA